MASTLRAFATDSSQSSFVLIFMDAGASCVVLSFLSTYLNPLQARIMAAFALSDSPQKYSGGGLIVGTAKFVIEAIRCSCYSFTSA